MNRSILFSSIAAATLALTACDGDETGNGEAGTETVAADSALVSQVVKTEEGGFLMGNPDAPVRLTEYASLVCVHCRDFEQEAFDDIKQLVSEGKISFEFRNFILGGTDIAPTLLSRCGGEDRFFALTDAWYDNWDTQMQAIQTGLQDEAFRQSLDRMSPTDAAARVAEATGAIDFFASRGISRDEAMTCLADEAAFAEVEALRTQGIEDGVQGTPSFFINGEKVDYQGWPAMKAQLTGAGAG